MIEAMEESGTEVYHLSDEERLLVDEGLDQAKRGQFVSDEDMEKFWNRHGGHHDTRCPSERTSQHLGRLARDWRGCLDRPDAVVCRATGKSGSRLELGARRRGGLGLPLSLWTCVAPQAL